MLPNNLLRNVEVIVRGNITAGGSNAKKTWTVFHYQRTTVVNTPDETAFDTIFQSTVVSKIILAVNARWSQAYNTVRFYDDPLRVALQLTHVNAGAVAGDGMPSFNYAYLLKKSAIRGARYRGNNKIGPLSESDTTAGTEDVLNAAALTRMGAIATAMLANLTDGNGNIWTPVILSRKLSALTILPQASVAVQPVATVSVNKRIGRMKVRETASSY